MKRLAHAGADFFVCPDNTAHLALEQPGDELSLPGLHIAEVVADRAARDGRIRVGVLGTRYLMDGPIYPRALANRGIATEIPEVSPSYQAMSTSKTSICFAGLRRIRGRSARVPAVRTRGLTSRSRFPALFISAP